MIRGILVVVFMFLAVSIGLVFNPISPRDAGGQVGGGISLGLESAGVYVEEAVEAPRIVVIYADGNWTLQSGDAPLSFGVWQPAAEELTVTAKLVDSLGGTEDYTLTFDADLQSVTVEGATESFIALREPVETVTQTEVGQ